MTIGIREAARLLHRVPGTLRKWEQLGVVPEYLRPRRDQRNRRFWTMEQIDGLKQWIQDTDRHQGKGLPGYDPRKARRSDTFWWAVLKSEWRRQHDD